MSINLSALMKQRYDTAANWTAQNPTLLAGEIGIESDTKKWKVGTGATAWTSLVYAIGGTYPIVNADVAAAAAIVDTKLATISTALKVSNSATTAASANTASAIVARDASGNFTAGTITAALTGAASSNVLKAGDTMTGVLAVTAGTAALPGIATSGYLGTGIYSPSPNQLGISTNGASRIVVSTTAVSSTLPVAINGATSTATLSLPAGSNINAAGVNLYYDTNSTYSSGADRYIVNGVAARYIQDSGAHVWQRAASGTAGNAITFLGSMQLDDSGRLLVGGVSANANGGILQLSSGITFPATAVAASDANTLDDYEEGTWTPVYTASTTNPTMVYNAAEGRYTKVGRLVTCYFHMRTNASSTGGGAGDLLVSGLPFTSANIEVNAGRQSGAIGGSSNFGALNYPNGIIVNNNSTTAALQIIYTTANTTAVDASTLSLAGQGNSLFGCFSYITG